MRKLFILFIVLGGFAVNSFGQASTNGTATAKLVTPIAISATRNLAFGTLARTTVAGSVTIANTAAGARTGSNVDLVGTPTNNSAEFSVTGEVATAYTVTLPSNGATTIASGANTMGVDFTLSAGAGALTASPELFYVGGTLSVSATQPAGDYTGTFAVTVAYN